MSWDRYAGEVTGIEGEIWSGRVFTPRFYCDDPTATGIYTTKPPACHLTITPRVQYLAQSQAWDISNSRSATGTISTYSINFGGGGVANITGAAWSGAKTGSVTYNAVGTYTVEAWVTDLLGTESQHVFITVEVVDVGELAERLYIGTTDTGLFTSTNGSTPATSNTGLSGDDLRLRAVRVHPAYADLPPSQQHVWLVSKSGLAYSINGGTTWTEISEATLGTPVNTAGDSPAPTASDPDNIDLAFDPQDARRLYVLRTTTTPNLRAWLYMSDDYGATWSNTQVGI